MLQQHTINKTTSSFPHSSNKIRTQIIIFKLLIIVFILIGKQIQLFNSPWLMQLNHPIQLKLKTTKMSKMSDQLKLKN